jgi:hypothetical protein
MTKELKIFDLTEPVPTIWHGKVSKKQIRWGQWHWDKDSPTELVYKDEYGHDAYPIDLLGHAPLTNARNIYFWVHQLLGKRWVTAKIMRDFLWAVEDLTGHDTHNKFYHRKEDFDLKKQLDELWEEVFEKHETS